jgi:cell division protein FtsB
MTIGILLRAMGRALVAAAILGSISMIAVQYTKMAHRNLVLARALAATQSYIARLKTSREQRLATIKRLEDPRGAIPEIHDRLHLTLPNEAIIYLKKPAESHP